MTAGDYLAKPPYNGDPLAIASLASQKRHMALYLNWEYASPTDFRER